MGSADATNPNYLLIQASNNATITFGTNAVYVSANTPTVKAQTGGTVYANSGMYFVLAETSNKNSPNYMILTASNNIIVTTATNIIYVSANTPTVTAQSGGTVYANSGMFFVVAQTGNQNAPNYMLWSASTGMTVTTATNAIYESVNSNIRDKIFTFFFAGNLNTGMAAQYAKIYLNNNFQLIDCYLALSNTSDQAVTINPQQYNANGLAGTGLFVMASLPMILTTGLVGEAKNFTITNLYAGSWLGVTLSSIGTVTYGSNLTVNLIARTS